MNNLHCECNGTTTVDVESKHADTDPKALLIALRLAATNLEAELTREDWPSDHLVHLLDSVMFKIANARQHGFSE